MTISQSRCTAHHEAAHAVIYLHFGIEVEQVTLCRDEAGLCSVANDLLPSEGRLLAILAGPAADQVLLKADPNALRSRESGWKLDYERAAEVSLLLGRGESIDAARIEAAKLVNEKWRIICSLAELWICASEENFAAGDPQYIMNGYEVKSLVGKFSVARTASPGVP